MIEKSNIPGTRNLSTESTRPDTNTYFNNLYKPEFVATADQESAIQSFFEEYTGSVDSARIFTTAVIFTSLSQNLNPMSVLADFKKIEKNQLTVYLSAFLNLNRVNSSLLGVSNTPGVGIFVKRSILV
jgi:hypothetical protein